MNQDDLQPELKIAATISRLQNSIVYKFGLTYKLFSDCKYAKTCLVKYPLSQKQARNMCPSDWRIARILFGWFADADPKETTLNGITGFTHGSITPMQAIN